MSDVTRRQAIISLRNMRTLHPGFPERDIRMVYRIPEACPLVAYLREKRFMCDTPRHRLLFGWNYMACHFYEWTADASQTPWQWGGCASMLVIGDQAVHIDPLLQQSFPREAMVTYLPGPTHEVSVWEYGQYRPIVTL